jgi:hypothetical protein
MSVSTVKTVDDVMSLMEEKLGDSASLSESRRFITNLGKRDSVLASSVLEEIESIRSVVSPITQNIDALTKLMVRTGAVLGGLQATSFFYPLCDLTGAPWDIFCHTDTADDFITNYIQSSGSEIVEDVSADNLKRVVHLRRSVPGCSSPVNVRVFVCNSHPISSVMDLRNTYEHTVISAAGAIHFWPRLTSKRIYRVFDSNLGTSAYPRGKTFYEITSDPLHRTRPRKQMEVPEIFSGLESRVESVIFKNVCNVPNTEYCALIDSLEGIVYSVFNSSTKYLGHTGDMH